MYLGLIGQYWKLIGYSLSRVWNYSYQLSFAFWTGAREMSILSLINTQLVNVLKYLTSQSVNMRDTIMVCHARDCA